MCPCAFYFEWAQTNGMIAHTKHELKKKTQSTKMGMIVVEIIVPMHTFKWCKTFEKHDEQK